MYSRNFRPGENRKEGNVPVQLFGDSFSADAFIKNGNNAAKRENEETLRKENINNAGIDMESTKISEQSTQASAVSNHERADVAHEAKRANFDDLLLLGLIFLFLTNTEKKDDIILPVILSAILMFQ